MKFDKHPELEGTHAFMSASQFRWLNYDDEKLMKMYESSFATDIGTAIHKLAAEHIDFRVPISKVDKHEVQMCLLKARIPKEFIDAEKILSNLVGYVNDAIKFGMEPEVKLVYSDVCYGTTDAIQYYDKTKTLRIHDLKTGDTPAHMEQLQVYAALFFLNYGTRLGVKPNDVHTELRIYQSGEAITLNADPKDTIDIMQTIKHDCDLINKVGGGRILV